MNDRAVEQILAYTFDDRALLMRALTHASYANERTGNPSNGNERLEFLGDAILDAVISVHLYRRERSKKEGDLTRLRALIVCEKSLSAAGREFGLNEYILLGRGEELGGGRQRPSIVADAFEALIGAVYLDGGMEAAEAVVLRLLDRTIRQALEGKLFSDYKTELQERIQHRGWGEPFYRTMSEEGPDHAKHFTVSVNAGGKRLAIGTGRSKKEAEQDAARQALEGGQRDGS